MKNIDLNTVKDLTTIKENILKIFDKRINEAKINDFVNSIDNLSFIYCKQLFEGISDKLFDSTRGKKLIGKYARLIKENKDLKNLYFLSENLTTKQNITDAKLYISECANFSVNLEKDSLDKLHKILKEAVKLSGLGQEELNDIVSDNKELNESIDFILTNKKTLNNVNEYTKHINILSEALNKSTNDKINETANIEDITNLLDEEELETWEKDIVEEIVMANLAGKTKENVFENLKNECISIIEESCKVLENEAMVSRLKLMKEQLSNKEYNKETINEDLIKLSELRKTLKEE